LPNNQLLWLICWAAPVIFGNSLLPCSAVESREVNEALCKALCHTPVVLIHEMHELRIEPVFWSNPFLLFAELQAADNVRGISLMRALLVATILLSRSPHRGNPERIRANPKIPKPKASRTQIIRPRIRTLYSKSRHHKDSQKPKRNRNHLSQNRNPGLRMVNG
jgi:hypothetical protein